MRKKIILSITIAITLIACNSNPEEKVEEVVVEQEVVVEEEIHEHGDEAIVLDNGKKWIVVPEMMVFIRAMEKGVEDFSLNENPTSKDYQALAVLIDQNIRKLTSNCTMEGQAHDELHKWLLPFIERSTMFDEATKLEDQEHIYQEFKLAYETFNIYFK